MTNYYRVRLGRGNSKAQQCYDGEFIGTHYGVNQDLSYLLNEDMRSFNEKFHPIYKDIFPDKSKHSAISVGSIIWRVSVGMNTGDVVISPRPDGRYQVGEIEGNYYYQPDDILCHRRKVIWSDQFIASDEISDTFQITLNSRSTVISIDQYSDDIEALISGQGRNVLVSLDEDIIDPSNFAMERHLEEFLVANWSQSELGRDYDILEEDGEITGQQFQTDTGPLDILAISKDRKTLLVVELKKGRASDAVVGQVMRYMGYVQDVVAEPSQQVRGAIIALEDTQRLRRARSVTSNIDFYRYEISFRLMKE